MHALFKECLDKGEIDPNPVWECQGVKSYMFTGKGKEMTAARFLDYTDTLKAYYTFNLEQADVDLFLEMEDKDDDKIMLYLSQPNSIQQIIKERQGRRREFMNRRSYGIPLDRTFVLGSFIIVEENENPLYYDRQYNEEKIKRWKNHLDVEKKISLLRVPFPILGDTTRLLESDFLNSMMLMNMLNATQLRILLLKSDLLGLSNEMITTIESRMETLLSSENYLREISSVISDS